jgi:dTDP-glucose 4,6-dehydratase
MARAYAWTHGLNVSITRCSNNYGPYQYPEKVIPLFVTNLMEGKPVPLYGDGLNVRGWIHVDDHCRGIQLVLERGECGRIYHINGDIELTNRELTAAILEACGADWDAVTMVEDRKGHDRRYSLDDSVLRAIGYRAVTHLLSDDVFTIDPVKIREVKILTTWVGGKIVWDAAGKSGH